MCWYFLITPTETVLTGVAGAAPEQQPGNAGAAARLPVLRGRGSEPLWRAQLRAVPDVVRCCTPALADCPQVRFLLSRLSLTGIFTFSRLTGPFFLVFFLVTGFFLLTFLHFAN